MFFKINISEFQMPTKIYKRPKEFTFSNIFSPLILILLIWIVKRFLSVPTSNVVFIFLSFSLIVFAIIELFGIGLNWPIKFFSPVRMAIIFGCICGFLCFSFLPVIEDVTNSTLTFGKYAKDVSYFIAIISTWSIFCFAYFLFLFSFNSRKIEKLMMSSSMSPKVSASSVENLISEKFSIINSWFEREVVAFTSTCIPFEYISETTVRLYLVQNPNFKNWWLAPGGHVEFNANETPDQIADEKCFSEAGLKVKLLSPSDPKINYEGCRTTLAPHFFYIINVDQTSKCAKSRHHRFHYDFTFVGDVVSIESSEGKHDRIGIELPINSTLAQISEEILRQTSTYTNNKYGVKPSAHIFPLDFPVRIEQALRIFSEYIEKNKDA